MSGCQRQYLDTQKTRAEVVIMLPKPRSALVFSGLFPLVVRGTSASLEEAGIG